MRSINLLKAKSHPRCIVKGLSGRKTARNICAAAAGAAGWSSELSVRFLCSCSTWKSFNKASLSAREAISVCRSWSERRLVYEGESSNLVLAFSHKLQTTWGESRHVNRCPLSHVAHSFNMLNSVCASVIASGNLFYLDEGVSYATQTLWDLEERFNLCKCSVWKWLRIKFLTDAGTLHRKGFWGWG